MIATDEGVIFVHEDHLTIEVAATRGHAVFDVGRVLVPSQGDRALVRSELAFRCLIGEDLRIKFRT